MCRKYVVKCVQESNLHPLAYWSTALPVELVGQVTSNLLDSPFVSIMVGAPKTQYTFLYSRWFSISK